MSTKKLLSIIIASSFLPSLQALAMEDYEPGPETARDTSIVLSPSASQKNIGEISVGNKHLYYIIVDNYEPTGNGNVYESGPYLVGCSSSERLSSAIKELGLTPYNSSYDLRKWMSFKLSKFSSGIRDIFELSDYNFNQCFGTKLEIFPDLVFLNRKGFGKYVDKLKDLIIYKPSDKKQYQDNKKQYQFSNFNFLFKPNQKSVSNNSGNQSQININSNRNQLSTINQNKIISKDCNKPNESARLGNQLKLNLRPWLSDDSDFGLGYLTLDKEAWKGLNWNMSADKDVFCFFAPVCQKLSNGETKYFLVLSQSAKNLSSFLIESGCQPVGELDTPVDWFLLKDYYIDALSKLMGSQVKTDLQQEVENRIKKIKNYKEQYDKWILKSNDNLPLSDEQFKKKNVLVVDAAETSAGFLKMYGTELSNQAQNLNGFPSGLYVPDEQNLNS